jgi:hypothetical protein
MNAASCASHEVAHRLLSRGLSVIPVPAPQPGIPLGRPGDGKVPAIAWRTYQTRYPTTLEIDAWFGSGPMNIAVVTGALSGVVVIDPDNMSALRWCVAHLPYTPWQTQTARSFHLWYRHPGGRVPNRACIKTKDGRLAIDQRGDGGYVIAAESRHRSGTIYLEAGDWTATRDRLPVFSPDWFAVPRPVRPVSRPCFGGEPLARARAYLWAIPTPEIGAGSDTATFYPACRLVGRFGLSAVDAEALLSEWAGRRPGWTPEWITRKVANAQRYGREPVEALP